MRMVIVEFEVCFFFVGNFDWNIIFVFLLYSLNVENKICKNIIVLVNRN